MLENLINGLEDKRVELDKSIQDFADELEISYMTYNRWVNGIFKPRYEEIVKINKFLDNKEKYEDLFEDLEKLRKDLDMSIERFALQKLDVSYPTYLRWRDGDFNPSFKKVEKIKELLEKERSTTPP